LFQGKNAKTLWVRAVEIYVKQKKYKEAAFVYEKIAKLAEVFEASEFWSLAADCYLKVHMKKEALFCFSEILRDRRPVEYFDLLKELHPGSPMPKVLSTGAALEEKAEHLDDVRAIWALTCAGSEYNKQGQFLESGFVYAKAANLAEGSNKTHLLHQAARQFVQARKYSNALNILELVLQEQGNVSLWIQIHSLINKLLRFLRMPDDQQRARDLISQVKNRF